MEPKKNPKANLEKYRVTLVLLGICAAGAVTATALEMIQVDATVKPIEEEQFVLDDAAFDINIPQDEEPPPPPEEPPEVEPPPAPPDDIEETDDEDEESDAEFSGEVTPPPPPPPPPPPKKVEIVDFPQQTAEFPGGTAAMYEYLGKHMQYPRMAREANIEGKVYVQFVVWTDGSISDVKVLKGIGGGCDEEATRVVKSMPKWAPAEQAGQKVASRFMLPVVFRLN